MTRNILIISPDTSLWEEIRRAHEGACCSVATVASRRAAVAQLELQHVDIVVADLESGEDYIADLLDYVAARYPLMYRLGVCNSADRALCALDEGSIDNYITRPWSHDKLYGILAEEFENGTGTENRREEREHG